MSGFNVTLGDGTVVSIKAGEKIEDIKNKFGAEAGGFGQQHKRCSGCR